jgi:hypothetical protein
MLSGTVEHGGGGGDFGGGFGGTPGRAINGGAQTEHLGVADQVVRVLGGIDHRGGIGEHLIELVRLEECDKLLVFGGDCRGGFRHTVVLGWGDSAGGKQKGEDKLIKENAGLVPVVCHDRTAGWICFASAPIKDTPGMSGPDFPGRDPLAVTN